MVTFKDFAWFCVVALIVVYLSKCHRDKSDVYQNEVKAITEQAAKLDSISREQIRELHLRLQKQETETMEALQRTGKAEAALHASEKTVLRLSSAVRSSKNVGSSFVTVPPEFVEYCDSLATESEILVSDLSKYKGQHQLLSLSMLQEMAIRDSMITAERNFSDACRKQFADLQTVYGRMVNSTKARNQVFIGAEISGTQATIFQNVGAVLSLKTKGNKLWQVSTGLQYNGGLYAQFSGNILITFKR